MYGPSFLTKTRSSFDLPPGSPSIPAINAFVTNFPNATGGQPAIIIVVHSKAESGVLCPYVEQMSAELDLFVSKHPDIMSGVIGYYQLIGDSTLRALASSSVSNNSKSMMMTVLFTNSATGAESEEMAFHFLRWTKSYSTNIIQAYATGQPPLFART
jgi:hypothetical protein